MTKVQHSDRVARFSGNRGKPNFSIAELQPMRLLLRGRSAIVWHHEFALRHLASPGDRFASRDNGHPRHILRVSLGARAQRARLSSFLGGMMPIMMATVISLKSTRIGL